MQEVAITYFVVFWLAAQLIDLLIIVARGPVLIDPIAKLVIVIVCLAIVIINLSRHRWLI